MSSTLTEKYTKDEAEIRALIDKWSRAVERKDVDAIMADADPEMITYDAIPPFQLKGADALRHVWEMCLPHLPVKFQMLFRDLRVTVVGDMAYATGFNTMMPEGEACPCGDTWLRTTQIFRRIDGNWRAVHAHISVPFDCFTNKAWFSKDPENQVFDWSAAGCPDGSCE